MSESQTQKCLTGKAIIYLWKFKWPKSSYLNITLNNIERNFLPFTHTQQILLLIKERETWKRQTCQVCIIVTFPRSSRKREKGQGFLISFTTVKSVLQYQYLDDCNLVIWSPSAMRISLSLIIGYFYTFWVLHQSQPSSLRSVSLHVLPWVLCLWAICAFVLHGDLICKVPLRHSCGYLAAWLWSRSWPAIFNACINCEAEINIVITKDKYLFYCPVKVKLGTIAD